MKAWKVPAYAQTDAEQLAGASVHAMTIPRSFARRELQHEIEI
jgi:hypothetical protein